MTQRLASRVAIVTGGSSGIGRAITRKFASHGAVVIVADITTDAIEGGRPVCDIVTEDGGKAVFVRTDVSSSSDVDAMVAETVLRFGRLDILVNNAVLRAGKPLVETEEADGSDAGASSTLQSNFLSLCERQAAVFECSCRG